MHSSSPCQRIVWSEQMVGNIPLISLLPINIICFTTFSGLGCSCCPGALAQGSSLKPQPCSPAADFHPLTVPALCQDTHIHPFPNLSPRARLQKIDHPCLWIEPGSLGCLFALHSNTKATTASESPGAWPGGHNHSSVTS